MNLSCEIFHGRHNIEQPFTALNIVKFTRHLKKATRSSLSDSAYKIIPVNNFNSLIK